VAWCCVRDLILRFGARQIFGAVAGKNMTDLVGDETDSEILGMIAESADCGDRLDAAIADGESALRGALSRYDLPDDVADSDATPAANWLRAASCRFALLSLQRAKGFTDEGAEAKACAAFLQALRDGDTAPPPDLRIAAISRPALVVNSIPKFASF
jgi:hypothetical protein